ncbi:MAG TPA: histidine phosphatase family protein [Burkholderiaceae bacterium]|nr:histidine phosphatase family protein [Burkholderiaceae bacterium]
MKVWLLRHGRPLVAPGICYGKADVAADPEHTAQAAQTLWAHWRSNGQPVPQVVWCSPRQRTRQLASALQAVGLNAPVQLDERLAEMDFGAWEGQPWADIAEAELTAWSADFTHHRAGGGECVRELLHRVADAWAALGSETADVLWVTHGGVIRAVQLVMALGGSATVRADQWPRQGPEPGEWISLDWQPPRP